MTWVRARCTKYREQGVLVLACVVQDMIKVWPLPVVQPWWEDEVDQED